MARAIPMAIAPPQTLLAPSIIVCTIFEGLMRATTAVATVIIRNTAMIWLRYQPNLSVPYTMAAMPMMKIASTALCVPVSEYSSRGLDRARPSVSTPST